MLIPQIRNAYPDSWNFSISYYYPPFNTYYLYMQHKNSLYTHKLNSGNLDEVKTSHAKSIQYRNILTLAQYLLTYSVD
jgi:hypothetical protein